MYIIYGPHIKSDNKKKLCIRKWVVVWYCVLHRSYDIVSVRAHCVDMTDTREWLKRSSEKCKLIKLSILAGLEPTRINPIEYESIALTNRLHNLFHVPHTYLASQYIKFSKSTIYPNTF